MIEQQGYDFMAAAVEVYNRLDYGLAEEIYQQNLEIELGLRGICYASKSQLEVYYKNHLLATRYIPDLLVFDEIFAEQKAVKRLISEHEAQLFNYMRISRKRVGYLISFGALGKVEWKRFVFQITLIVTD